MMALRIPAADICECGHTQNYHDIGGCHAFEGTQFEYDCGCPGFKAVGRSPEDPPAHTSGSESPDSSRDCPRCAALTRKLADAREVTRVDAFHLNRLIGVRDDLMRDLAQARQALSEMEGVLNFPGLTDRERLLTLHAHIADALAVAREALVERGTEQTDTGVAQSRPCAGGSAVTGDVLCECGHYRSCHDKQGRCEVEVSDYGDMDCACDAFKAQVWTQKELDEAKQRAADFRKTMGWA